MSILSLAVLVGLAPSALAWEPTPGGIFNNPRGTQAAKFRIVNHVNQAVRNTPAGARVLISGYLFDAESSADALVNAHDRGVHVQMVLDGQEGRTTQSRRVANVLNADNGNGSQWGPDNSYLVFCSGSCRGPGTETNNHTKFYAFSRTGTATDVVMVSSSNLNRGGATRGFNDLYTTSGNQTMFDHYAGVLAEMATDTAQDGDRFREFVDGLHVSRFFPMTEDYDPTMRDLSKVQCRGATGGAGHNGRTAINISMFVWREDRGVKLANRAVELDNNGCDVKVVYGAIGDRVRDILHTSAKRGGVSVWNSRNDFNHDGSVDVRTHEKGLLINGVYGGDTSAWQVTTGSQNWGGGLTIGDDVTLNVTSRATYVDYIDNWRYIANNWSRRIR